MSNISKIRVCRELIKLDHLLLHDRPIELTSAQIDYLLSAGFEGNAERRSFIYTDKHLEIEYLVIKERENEN